MENLPRRLRARDRIPQAARLGLVLRSCALAFTGISLFAAALFSAPRDPRRTPAGAVLKEARWDTDEVSVCFSSRSQKNGSRLGQESKTFPEKLKLLNPTTSEKKWIREIIEQEYTREKTGIRFVGWKDCDSKDPAQVWIAIGSGGPEGASGIGQDMLCDHYIHVTGEGDDHHLAVMLRSEKPLKPGYVFFRRIDPQSKGYVYDYETALKWTALHEFGHVAGLIHENERKETLSDGNCNIGRERRHAQRTMHVEYTSEYDPGSVMSYCFLYAIARVAGDHYQVARPGRAGLSPDGLPLLAWPGVNLGGSEREVSRRELSDRIEIRIRPGLSRGDQIALRCLYAPETLSDPQACRPDFSLRSGANSD